jgi:ribosomal protein S12 methylthiotransferase accessory factor
MRSKAVDLRDGDVATPLADSLPRLRRLVSPYTGIVRLSFQLMAAPGDPKMAHVTCISANSAATIGGGGPDYSGGINPSYDRALAAAIGEAAERYAASSVPVERLRLATARELSEPHVDPATVGIFSPEQYASDATYVPFGADTPVQWVLGDNLATGEGTLIPSHFCYLPDHLVEGEARITYSTSSGLACGSSYGEALLSALYELVERDAFVLTWYGRLALPLLEWPGVDVLELEERLYYQPTGVEYRAVDLSAFCGVPTAMVVVRDPSAFVGLAVGAASARTSVEAVRKALREGFQTHAWARQIRLGQPDWTTSADFSEIKTFEDHVACYAFGKYPEETAFIDAGPQRRHVEAVPALCEPSVSEQIGAIVGRLQARGIDAYALDVTSPDVRDVGLCVVRVFCPQLARLDAGYTFRFLGVPRLYSGAYEAGVAPRPFRADELNTLPHPFP